MLVELMHFAFSDLIWEVHEILWLKMSPRNLADDWSLIGKFCRRRGGGDKFAERIFYGI